MEKLLSVNLAQGAESVCLIAKDIRDLSAHLSGYGQNVLWVFDTNTSPLFKQLPANRIVIEAGEKHKTIETVEKILSEALSFGLSRDSRFIAFGGGVVCDMTSLASSLYMRGAKLTLVPTTLLSMVDASLGGKTGVDYGGAKNIVGTFYPADEVLISVDVLRTLPLSEYMSGLGEVLKHAFLSPDDRLLNYLEANREKVLSRDKETIREIVSLSLVVKKHYLELDPKETKGIRSMLNFGHTFAHALEAIGHFTYSHGQAVAWGCCRAFELGVKMGLSDKEYAERGIALFKSYGYNAEYRIERGRWLEFQNAVAKDKKKIGGSVKFVICRGQGDFVLAPVESRMLQSVAISTPL
jgi:3-dehydroquinate synthetase